MLARGAATGCPRRGRSLRSPEGHGVYDVAPLVSPSRPALYGAPLPGSRCTRTGDTVLVHAAGAKLPSGADGHRSAVRVRPNSKGAASTTAPATGAPRCTPPGHPASGPAPRRAPASVHAGGPMITPRNPGLDDHLANPGARHRLSSVAPVSTPMAPPGAPSRRRWHPPRPYRSRQPAASPLETSSIWSPPRLRRDARSAAPPPRRGPGRGAYGDRRRQVVPRSKRPSGPVRAVGTVAFPSGAVLTAAPPLRRRLRRRSPCRRRAFGRRAARTCGTGRRRHPSLLPWARRGPGTRARPRSRRALSAGAPRCARIAATGAVAWVARERHHAARRLSRPPAHERHPSPSERPQCSCANVNSDRRASEMAIDGRRCYRDRAHAQLAAHHAVGDPSLAAVQLESGHRRAGSRSAATRRTASPHRAHLLACAPNSATPNCRRGWWCVHRTVVGPVAMAMAAS